MGLESAAGFSKFGYGRKDQNSSNVRERNMQDEKSQEAVKEEFSMVGQVCRGKFGIHYKGSFL
jgi:hypothetical protein